MPFREGFVMPRLPARTLLEHLRHLVQVRPDHGTDGELIRSLCSRREESAFAVLLERHGTDHRPGDDVFAVREEAQQALASMRNIAEPFLRESLDKNPSLEARHRID
jgi:hypothetical protein